MAGESKLQTKVRNKLRKWGWLVVKINLTSKPGWPDLYAIRDSVNIWIEVKDDKRPEKLQEYVQGEIRNKGGIVHNVKTWDEFLALNLQKN